MNNKSYWLFLEPYVHVTAKKNGLLLYNTLTGGFLEYDEKQPEVISLVKSLKFKTDSRVARLTDSRINASPLIERFVKDIKKYLMGDLIDTSMVSGRPFQMTPILNIFRDVNKLKKMIGRSVGEDIKRYLKEISFYITNQCQRHCVICNKAHRQFLSCYKGNHKYELAPDKIKDILDESLGSSLRRINFLGGDISSYPGMGQLASILEGFPVKKVFYTHYLNMLDHGKFLAIIAGIGGELEVLVDLPVNGEIFRDVFALVAERRISSCWTFVLQREQDLLDVQEIRSLFNIENVNLRPFYNRENIEFFEKYVYIKDKGSLFNSKLSLKELHCRQMVNPLNFGKIFVRADGKIISGYDDLSGHSKAGENSIYEAIYNEMVQGKNWFKVRARRKPCRSCIFNCICPPLSNYESVIGRNNLCHIFQ